MADIPRNRDFSNRLDNSDLQYDRDSKNIAVAYSSYDEARAYKEYLETLKLEAELQKNTDPITVHYTKADGSQGEKTIPVKDMIPVQGEFESVRRIVVQKLKYLAVGGPGDGQEARPAEIKQLMADFECEGDLFDLSSKIANYLIDKQRRDKVANSFNLDA